MKKWSEKEINETIKLLESGKTYIEIGFIVGRSPKSVKEKLNRLSLKYNLFKKSTLVTKSCVNCGHDFISNDYENRKFCSQSCSATFNNKFIIKRPDLKLTPIELRNSTETNYTIICKKCGETAHNKKSSATFCSIQCSSTYKSQIIREKIENGDLTQSPSQYKKYLIEKYGNKCMICGWCEINPVSGNVPIELEHIDGNSQNNSLENLKLLCPNHHSLTPTYKALNVGNGRHSRRERYKIGKSY